MFQEQVENNLSTDSIYSHSKYLTLQHVLVTQTNIMSDQTRRQYRVRWDYGSLGGVSGICYLLQYVDCRYTGKYSTGIVGILHRLNINNWFCVYTMDMIGILSMVYTKSMAFSHIFRSFLNYGVRSN